MRMKLSLFVRILTLSFVLALFSGICFMPNDAATMDREKTVNTFQAPPSVTDSTRLKVKFFGVSTLLLDDGETAILTDGFFSRPNLIAVATRKIAPDRELIARSLEKAGITKLSAVLVTHSHYDHAMDSPEVALRTGAVLAGSESTANIARGWGMPENRIISVKDHQTLKYGRFEITFIPSEHAPLMVARGTITSPLVPPVRAVSYKDGGSYAILIKHDGRSILVQSSAGIATGALKGTKADVVFLGVGLLGKQTPEFRTKYWNEVVKEVGARRVIPVHWDDFSKSLDSPLVPTPWPLDEVKKAMAFLKERGAAEGVDVRMPAAWGEIDPFGSLN